VYNLTDTTYLLKAPTAWAKQAAIENSTIQAPQYYYFEGYDSSGDPYVNFVGTPDGVYTINFNLVVPQSDLTTGTTQLTAPSWPVILGAYAKAIAERGEDDGRAHGEALGKYASAVSDAIAIDVSITEDEDTWYVE